MSLAKRTVTGIFWNFSEQIGRRGVNVLVTLLLARFLVPEDFGLVAIISVIVAIASGLMESGFKQALIRMKDAALVDYNTAFFANLGLGMLSYGIIFSLAPMVARYFEEPALADLIRVGGITILINAFRVVQSAILSKELNFKALLMASLPASMVSGVVAVLLAYGGMGVWALIVQMVLYALLATMFTWNIGSWRPTLAVSRHSFHQMFSFGSRLFAASTLDTVFRNLYVIVIAKIFDTTIVGYYFFADKIRELIINQLVSSIRNVTYPALSTVQNDNVKLKDGFRKVLRVTTFSLFPAMAFLAALAEPLFKVFLPGNWEPAVPYLQLLCLAGILIPVHSVNLNILQVKGRSDLFLRLEIIKKAMLVVVLSVSVKFGIYGILIGQIITSIIAYIPNSYFTNRLINYSAREQLADFLPALFLSGTIGGLVYFFVVMLGWSAYAELLLFGVLAPILYLAVAYIFKMEALTLAVRLSGYEGSRNAD